MAKKMDLTGQRFGRLTVIEEAEKGKNNQRRWSCRCDCGNVVTVAQRSLRAGITKSCGCLRAPSVEIKPGDRFGRLVVLEDIGGDNYLCRCDCGNVVSRKGAALRTGSVKSCGCLRREVGLEKMESFKKREYTDGTALPLIKPGRKPGRNTSGRIGVFWFERTKRWGARIGFQNKMIHLGYFDTFEEAVAAREAAEEKYYKPTLEKHGKI